MALYFGGNKQRVNFNNKSYFLNLFVKTVNSRDNVLLSSDNQVLQDINGLYLIAKESE